MVSDGQSVARFVSLSTWATGTGDSIPAHRPTINPIRRRRRGVGRARPQSENSVALPQKTDAKNRSGGSSEVWATGGEDGAAKN
jgi:hypothetical protein